MQLLFDCNNENEMIFPNATYVGKMNTLSGHDSAILNHKFILLSTH